ncbi:hypothetical protein SAMN04488515_2097 [Cognatiyoonia koreensis]|uniref:Cation/multidrug efflux pump n=1 Tax=Cognatiyoonia koreensis TaxID=364200 RepID=A0A1I0QQW5_9RHOB|nr:hypothetical protein [Cognatiyoonia koreensis]SEW29660.1 hypothetical protein SAMN04488515_2097 [Cognatiyoonia koreensis]
MVFVRFLIFGFIAMTVVYVCLWFYSRSVRREKLEDQWDAERPDGISRDDFVKQGMEAYHSSLRPKLLLLVYVVPTLVVGTILFIINAN